MNPKPRILILNGSCLDVAEDLRDWMDSLGVEAVAEPAFRRIDASRLDEVLAGANALLLPATVPIRPETMAKHVSLQMLSVAASGYEWLDVAAATQHGIVVTNAPVPELSEAVADHTFGLMLALARQIPYHHQAICRGDKIRGMGSMLWGKTLGIIGLGNIGQAVARRARGFDMRVLAFTPHPKPDFASRHSVEFVSLDGLLRQADIVSLHARLKPGMEGMIGDRELRLMKPTAHLINTARQQLVDEAALTKALLEGRIAGAAIDDPPLAKDLPLLSLPSFVCSPHLGNRAAEAMRAVLRCAMQNAVDVLFGRRPSFLLNPQVYDGHIRAPTVTKFQDSQCAASSNGAELPRCGHKAALECGSNAPAF